MAWLLLFVYFGMCKSGIFGSHGTQFLIFVVSAITSAASCLLPAWWLLATGCCLQAAGCWRLRPQPKKTKKVKETSKTPFKKIRARSQLFLPTRCWCNVPGTWSTGTKEQINLALPTPYKTSAAMMPEVRCAEVSFI